MTSFLVIGKNQEKKASIIAELCKQYTVDPLDATVIQSEQGMHETDSKKTTSIGIKTIRTLQQKVMLKPLKKGNKAVILEQADHLTIEAQNALLKTLEEPPAHTIIILAAESKDALLPTILSRSTILATEEQAAALTPKEYDMLMHELQSLIQAPIGQRFRFAEALAKDRDEALSWLDKMQLVVRSTMLQDTGSHSHIITMKALLDCRRIVQATNANIRLALEHCLTAFG